MRRRHPCKGPVVKLYPSKELCLRVAKKHHDEGRERLMWIWLVTWAFHEMYVDAYVG